MKQQQLTELNKMQSDSFPLTLGQKELWFIHTTGKAARSAYNESIVYSIKGPLQIQALELALNSIIKKHDALRTSFVQDEEGNLFQKVHEHVCLNIELVKLTDEVEISNYINNTIKHPFDLNQPPLMRVALVNKNDQEHLLVIVIHHIIIDGTSFSIFVRDLNHYYNQIIQGKTAALNKSSINFQNHVLHEQNKFASEEYSHHVDKVADKLKGYSSLNFLTTPVSQQDRDLFSGQRVYFKLDANLCEKLNSTAHKHRVTVFHVLYAVYTMLIKQYTRSNDVLIGVPFANRESDQNQEILGYFINTMPIRQQIDEQDSFISLATKIKTNIFSTLGHQSVAFEHVSSKLNLDRKGLGQHPLIQALFVWGNTDKLQLSFEGVQAQSEHKYHAHTSKFDLSLFMFEENKEFVNGYFEYRDALFEKEMIAAFSRSFITLLKHILENPNAAVSSYSLLDADEQAYMKENFFTTRWDRNVTKSLPCLFSETVLHYPKNIGLIFENKRYDYETIDSKSNEWANYIRYCYYKTYGKTLESDTLIALCVDRNEDMIFVMLGILKAGAAYVPVDPQYPQDRINYILSHSKASLLLTHHEHDALELDFDKNLTIYLDDNEITKSEHFINRKPEHQISPKDIAYVLYTSGSTGKPKGVAVTHENVNCLFASLDKQFTLSDQDVWSLFHTFCFDISVWEIWGAFLYGGTLLVIPYKTTRDTQKFYQLIEKEKVTVLTQTASAFQMLINEDLHSGKKLENLRYVGFVGESLKVSILRPWAQKYGTNKPRLANLYGITETTVYTNYKFVEQQDIDKGRDNIGWPLEEFSICVLDNENHWCPVGIVGEICIGGRGLSRGYLYRDDLTKEKFFPDPYADYLNLPKGSLLYRTGDLGRWMADGSIEYLGRKDFQVKLRGFRIELSEIEAALGSYPGITHTVVLLKGEGDATYLAAYYTVKPDIQVEIASLMHHLKSFLPDYMIPSIVTELPSFPMTVNGKIDRKVLQMQEDVRSSIQALTPLTTQLQRDIGAIWSKLLNVPIDHIGTNSSFFELGGNSLLVVKMLGQLTSKLGLNCKLGTFITQPHIANLCQSPDMQIHNQNMIENFCARLKQDTILDAKIQALPENNPNLHNPKVILLTGTTGFLGAYLLHELLIKTTATIYCLVRSDTCEQALDKIINKQKKYNLYREEYLVRIKPILGDLSQPNLKLSQSLYDQLAEEVDAIMHVAAWVHHVYDYNTLAPTNVESVREAIKFASHCKNKSIHFVSTLAVAAISPLARLPGLDPNSKEALLSLNGYVSSKWVAEQLLSQATKRGIATHVYRPGNIIASSRDAIYEPENNHTLLRLKGMIQLGKALNDPSEQVEMMPVDLLSEAIIHLFKNPTKFCYNLNNNNSISWTEYLQLANNYGFEIEFIQDKTIWQQMLSQINETNAFYKLAQFYKYDNEDKAPELESSTIEPDFLIATPSYSAMVKQQLDALSTTQFLEKPT